MYFKYNFQLLFKYSFLVKPYLQTIQQAKSHSAFLEGSHFLLNIFKIYPNILAKTFINVWWSIFFKARWTSKYVNWKYHKKKQRIFWNSGIPWILPYQQWYGFRDFKLIIKSLLSKIWLVFRLGEII